MNSTAKVLRLLKTACEKLIALPCVCRSLLLVLVVLASCDQLGEVSHHAVTICYSASYEAAWEKLCWWCVGAGDMLGEFLEGRCTVATPAP